MKAKKEITDLQKEIIRLRGEDKTVEEIAEILSFDSHVIVNETQKLARLGVVFKRLKRGAKTRPPVVIKEHTREKRQMNCNCKYMGCKYKANYTWALVPLCESHFILIKDEAYFYYDLSSKKVKRQVDRVHYMTIASMIPWANKGMIE